MEVRGDPPSFLDVWLKICFRSAWDDPPVLVKHAPPLSSARPRWPFRRRQALAVEQALQSAPPPEEEPSFSDTLMELCGTLDGTWRSSGTVPGRPSQDSSDYASAALADVPDEQAAEESLLEDDISANFFRSVSVTTVPTVAPPDAKPLPLPSDTSSHLPLLEPQIPNDVIIVDVAVDNHTQGIVIEDGPCSGISLSSIQPHMPQRQFVLRKVRPDDSLLDKSLRTSGMELKDRPAGAVEKARVPPFAATQPARMQPERRHTLPAGVAQLDTPKQTFAAASRSTKPPPPLPHLVTALSTPVPEGPPSTRAGLRRSGPAPPLPDAGLAVVPRRRRDSLAPSTPSPFAPKATVGSLSVPSLPSDNLQNPLESPLATSAVLESPQMLSSAMVTSPVVVSPAGVTSPVEIPVAPMVSGAVPVPPKRKVGRPPKAQSAKFVAGRAASNVPGNPLPTPDATRPATPLIPLDSEGVIGQGSAVPQERLPEKRLSTKAVRGAQPSPTTNPVFLPTSALIPASAAASHAQSASSSASPNSGTPGGELKRRPGRPRKRVEAMVVEEVASVEAFLAASPMDPRAQRRAERAKAQEVAATRPKLIIKRSIFRPAAPLPGSENSSAVQNILAPAPVSGAIPISVAESAPQPAADAAPSLDSATEHPSGMDQVSLEFRMQRKRSASPDLEPRPPSPKRLRSPEPEPQPEVEPEAETQGEPEKEVELEQEQEQQQPEAELAPQPEAESEEPGHEPEREREQSQSVADDVFVMASEEPDMEEDLDDSAPMDLDVVDSVPATTALDVSEELPDAVDDDPAKVTVYRKETDATLVEGDFQPRDVAMEQYRTPESVTDVSEDADKASLEPVLPPPPPVAPAAGPSPPESTNDESVSLPDSEKTVSAKCGMSPDLSEWVQVTPILSDGQDDRSESGSVTSDKAVVPAPVMAAKPSAPRLPLVNYASDEDFDGEDDQDELATPGPATASAPMLATSAPTEGSPREGVSDDTELERLLFHDDPAPPIAAQRKGGSETEEDADSDDSELDPAVNSITGKPTVVVKTKSAAVVRYDDGEEDELVR